jgi:hypothetical protein
MLLDDAWCVVHVRVRVLTQAFAQCGQSLFSISPESNLAHQRGGTDGAPDDRWDAGCCGARVVWNAYRDAATLGRPVGYGGKK